MANNKMGNQSFILPTPPVIAAWANIAGKKESEGPLSSEIDAISKDSYFGQKTWEQGERKMQQTLLRSLTKKAQLTTKDLGLVLSGDLLNQCVGSSFSLRNMNIPH